MVTHGRKRLWDEIGFDLKLDQKTLCYQRRQFLRIVQGENVFRGFCLRRALSDT